MRKFVAGFIILFAICFFGRIAFSYDNWVDHGMYIREDASDDKTWIIELKTGEGTLSTSGSVATLSLSSYDISDDPNDGCTLTADQLTGRAIITNDGAGAKATYNLPDIPADIDTTTDTYVAYIYCEEDQSVDINPDNGDWIYDLTDATGDAIESKGVGNFIILIPHDSTGWWPHSFIGTWSDVD
jgi:hypothetical protein